MGVKVQRRGNERFESLLRRFRKEVSKAKIMPELRKRSFYVKPSDKRNGRYG